MLDLDVPQLLRVAYSIEFDLQDRQLVDQLAGRDFDGDRVRHWNRWWRCKLHVPAVLPLSNLEVGRSQIARTGQFQHGRNRTGASQ
jgi:hypothetical protein